MKNCNLCQCKDTIWEIIECLMDEAATYSIWDWAILKACLISAGVLLGSCFSGFFKAIRPLVTLTFFIAWIYTICRLVLPIVSRTARD